MTTKCCGSLACSVFPVFASLARSQNTAAVDTMSGLVLCQPAVFPRHIYNTTGRQLNMYTILLEARTQLLWIKCLGWCCALFTFYKTTGRQSNMYIIGSRTIQTLDDSDPAADDLDPVVWTIRTLSHDNSDPDIIMIFNISLICSFQVPSVLFTDEAYICHI